jgi:hypothetical protein
MTRTTDVFSSFFKFFQVFSSSAGFYMPYDSFGIVTRQFKAGFMPETSRIAHLLGVWDLIPQQKPLEIRGTLLDIRVYNFNHVASFRDQCKTSARQGNPGADQAVSGRPRRRTSS